MVVTGNPRLFDAEVVRALQGVPRGGELYVADNAPDGI